ncbi:MAG: hypothetical protein RL536_17, partial [Candidatus Parcubacteria bacterium]
MFSPYALRFASFLFTSFDYNVFMNTASPYFKTKDLKIPPQNIEAEKALLGSIMMRGEVMHDIVDMIKEASFYSNQHKAIWLALFELHSKSSPIDMLSVSARLKEKNLLDQSGGLSYLTEIINSVPSSTN